MKKIFSFTKKKKHSSGTPDNVSALSDGYDLKDKDLGKIHKAAFQGDLSKLKQLAKKNDINQVDKENRTALHIACATGHAEVVQFLVDSKAKLDLRDNQNRSALMKAVQGQHERCVSILLENHADPNLADSNGNTALHLAANIPSISTAVVLLQHGAEINAQNMEGFTPLTVAVREDRIEMAEFLLKETADVNSLDQEQRSPLMLAASAGQHSMVKLLLQFNPDITLQDSKGWSADDYAVNNGHHSCCLLITEHTTKRSHGTSVSHPGPIKKKKLGIPSQDVEAGFSLGGPATNKDLEDNSLSESVSRASKSANDEWPSTEEEEESVEKKPLKVNLNRIFGSKTGKAPVLPDTSLSDTESEPEFETSVQRIQTTPMPLTSSKTLQPSVDLPPVFSFPKSPQMASTPLPSSRKKRGSSGEDCGEEVEEEEEEEEKEVEEEEEEEEEDDDEEEEDEEDDDEEEEGEEDDSEQSDESEEKEEEGSEEQENNCVPDVDADSENIQNCSLTDYVRVDTQDFPRTNVRLSAGLAGGVKNEPSDVSEKNGKAETENTDLNSTTGVQTYAVSATLDVADDCIVSAIRVESKLSDEEESFAKDSMRSLDQKIKSDPSSTEVPIQFRQCKVTQSPGKIREVVSDRETEDDEKDSLSDDQNRAEEVWNDSEDEEENKTQGIAGRNLIACTRKLLASVGKNTESDVEDDASSSKEPFKGGKRSTSWGSSVEESDVDLPRERMLSNEVFPQKINVPGLDMQLKAAVLPSKQKLSDTSWHSSSPVPESTQCISPKLGIDDPKIFEKRGFPSSPHVKTKPSVATADESDWDSSKADIQTDLGAKVALDFQAPVNTDGKINEPHKCSSEGEGKDSIERESNDPSPVVSAALEYESTKNQTLHDDEESGASLPQVEEKSNSKNEEGDSSSWDDDEECGNLEKQNVSLYSDVNLPSRAPEQKQTAGRTKTEKGKLDNFETEDDVEEIPYSLIDGHYEGEDGTRALGEQLIVDKILGKDNESSEDSDSKHQEIQYDFSSATVKLLDAGHDSAGTASFCMHGNGKVLDESEARLTLYAPLGTKTASQSYYEGPTKDTDIIGQHQSSEVSDEALPQTDIDDVDLSSPDRSESTNMRWDDLKSTTEAEYQEQVCIEDEKVSDREEEQEIDGEAEGDTSDGNQSDVGGEVHGAASTALEAEVGQDKKRDFRSELGLDKGEEEESSWDSESNSELSNIPHKEEQDLHLPKIEEASAVEEPLKQTCSNKNDNREEFSKKDSTLQKKSAVLQREPFSICSKPKEDADIMEELGVGDVDDLEDGSDWDSSSTISKKILPGQKMNSALEEFQEDANSFGSEQKEDPAIPTSSTPQRSNSFGKSLPTTPFKSAPQPQPRARKQILQKPNSEEESDCEPENTRCSQETSSSDNQRENLAKPQAEVEPGCAELLLMAGRTEGSSFVLEEQQEKRKDDTVNGCEVNLHDVVPTDSVPEKKDDDRFEEKIGVDTPWEKRYEKLWVEVEKKEVKSTFKSVAGELKERFGELFKSRGPAENPMEDATPASSSPDEDSSDEEDGEVIVRPAARTRSTVLLTIPEQRESGQEESLAESPDNSLCEHRLLDCDQAVRDGIAYHKSAVLTADVGTASPQLTAAQRESKDETDHHIKPFPEDSIIPVFPADSTGHLREAGRSNADSEDKVEEAPISELASQNRPLDVSNAEGYDEEDMMKFNPEIGNKTTGAIMEEQQSCASWDSSETAVEKVGSEKPETGLGCLLSQAEGSQQEKQPVADQSTNRAPVQQSCNSKKQEKAAVEGTLQLELMVRGARPSRAPQTSTHVNGDPSTVFDDSSLSDMSDDEERLPTRRKQKTKIKNAEEMDMAEDLDELTESSDTATDDMDSPTSGYRHASLLIQKLDSSTLDSTSITKLQNIFHEYERSIQKVRSRHGYLAEKVTHLELERATLKSSLENVEDAKSLLEHNQLDLQTEVRNLKFQLKQEQENRHNASMMYNTTRDKLRRMEEQHQVEVQERQKVELTLRNQELEMRTLINNMKQLEEEHSETQRLLAQERSARSLQESLLSSHLRKQQEMEVENKRNISTSNEALSQLTEASDRERELLQQTASLQDQLSMLRSDLERSQANSSLKESHLVEENEALKEQLEDVRRDLKLSNDAVTQTVFTYNNQLATLKAELAQTTSRLENERLTREALGAEVESTRIRLVAALKEADLRLASHSDAEKALLKEREEHQRLKDRLTGELATQREAVSGLSQKLSKAEARANSLENEVHRVTMQLTEKGLLLDVLQRDKDQATTRVKELESALHAEREQVSRAGARQEATQERLAQAQSEAMLLRQQLEEAQNKGVAKERAVTDAQERFSDILSKLRSDCEERVHLVEDRNKELASKAADLRDQIFKLEEERSERETSIRQLQQELADSLKRLSMSEASLEVNTRYRNDLEEEKARLLKDNDRIRGKLEESEDQYVQAERHINSLKSSLVEREKELSSAAQKLQEALSASAATEITIKHLEEAVQKLEIENARLEAAAKQQSTKIETLQKGAQEAAMVRGRLEDLVTNLQSSKMTLEDQLNKEAQKQIVLSHTAQDSQALWEEELKSRSKLGLRLAELEKEKGELTTQMEVEKKKAKKMAEQKKAVDTRLDQEMKRNMELQKEMYRLRTLLKTAKKKLRDQEAGVAELSSPMSTLRMDLGRQNQAGGAFGWMKDKMDDLQGQLEKETSRRNQLEKINEELKDQVASLKDLGRSHDGLERSKRQLEEEVLELRRRLEAGVPDQIQFDQYRREADEKARQEIQQKLEQVNLFLQSQAASQEALDQIKAANEANLRSQLEQKIRELEGELGRARNSQMDSLNQKESTRSELERYRQLYTEEMRVRKSLAAKLERANSRLSEANSRLLGERSRSLITGNITNGSLVGPSLDLSSLGSPPNPGATLGSLNTSFGFSLLSPVADGHNRRVEDYLAKMQSELDKNISKELSNATAELDAASARLSPVGSASRVELDPLSRATQQYLEVLKKNHRI